MEVPSNVKNPITAEDINMDELIDSTQSKDIYKVQLKCNRALKLIALNILKYLPEDILREESDFHQLSLTKLSQIMGRVENVISPF